MLRAWPAGNLEEYAWWNWWWHGWSHVSHGVWMKEIVTNGGARCTFFSLVCRMNIYLTACGVCQNQWHLQKMQVYFNSGFVNMHVPCLLW
jgi:hypothetical protein